MDRPGRLGEPPADCHVPGGKDGIEHHSMAHDLPPSRRGVRHYEQARGRGRLRAESLLADLTRKADFLVETAKRFLDGGEFGLDLDDEERASRLMESEYVDRASLAENGVRHLDRMVPAEICERSDCDRHDVSVAFIDRPIEAPAAPPNVDLDPRLDGKEDPSERTHGERVGMAAFED